MIRSVSLAAVFLLALASPALAASSGGLTGTRPGGETAEFPLEHTDVRAEIAGDVVDVTVTQVYANPFKTPLEAVYVFPLPDSAAIHAMTILVGERRIVGRVETREEAEKIYERAKEAGKTAGLLAEERPNVFTQSLANILPGEEIRVEISYLEPLRIRDGRYRFVFPMVVGPRYVPEGVTDGDRISPPRLPEGRRTDHDIALSVRIRMGLDIEDVRSESHEIEVEDGLVTLAAGNSVPNKDFDLSFRVAGEGTRAAVTAHRTPGTGGYFSFLVEPPDACSVRGVRAHRVAALQGLRPGGSGLHQDVTTPGPRLAELGPPGRRRRDRHLLAPGRAHERVDRGPRRGRCRIPGRPHLARRQTCVEWEPGGSRCRTLLPAPSG